MEDTKPVPRAISVREETYQLITREAKARGMSRSLLVRAAVEAFVARLPRVETRPATDGGAK
jgi:hypothetical protein